MRIGPLELDRPLALAPMEDVSDAPFRRVCKELGADLVYTEFASCEALVRDIPRTLGKIRVYEHERPVAIQIFGSSTDSMTRAAAIAEEAGPDFIDVNCGCWVKNVVRRNEGAGLLRDLAQFEAVVRAVIAGTRLPVTVKTRLGWDEQSIVILEVARMLQDLGVQALCLHCRTRAQGHRGEADWSWLARLKETIRIPVIGNGDVTVPEDAQRMLATGCDGVMIGRGAIQNPWIFREIKHYLATSEHLPEPTVRERIELALRHLKLSVAERGEPRGVTRFRKYYAGYLKGLPWIAQLRREIMQYTEVAPIEERLLRFAEEVTAAHAA